MASGGTILKTRKQPSAEIRVTPLRIPDISVVAKTLLIRTYYPNSDRIKSDGTYAYRYDANGNRTGKGTHYTDNGTDIEYSALEGEVWTYRYDPFNRLAEVRKSYEGTENLELAASYSYDHRSLRVQRTDREGISTCYAYSPQGKLLSEETDNVITEYIYLGNKLAAKRTAGRTLWYSTDHLGSTIMLTDDAGEIVWSEGYTAFGEASGKTGYEIEEWGRYTGKDYDEATGLYYYNARWYDASLGRFITEDPARDGANWYVYVRNNPLRYVDPTGLRIIKDNDETGRPVTETGKEVGDRHRQERADRREREQERLKENIEKKETAIREWEDAVNNPTGALAIKRAEDLIGLPYGAAQSGISGGEGAVSTIPITADCSELVSYAHNTPLYRTWEFRNNPDFIEVKTPLIGDVILDTAKTGDGAYIGHISLYTGNGGNKEILHSDTSGVRYSKDYIQLYYTKRGYTDLSRTYYRRIDNDDF